MQVGGPPLTPGPLREENAADLPAASNRASGVSTDSLAVEVHPDPLSPELWETYERTARSYACTREFVEYFDRPVAPALALVRRGDGEIRGAFLFTRNGGTVRVLGRFTAPPAETIAAFSEAMFSRDPGVRRVETGLVDVLPDPHAVGRPLLAVLEATEMRLALPATVPEYERMLGKDFLARTRYHERRLARELPAARFSTLEGAEIPRWWIAETVRLNRERMASKNVRSVFGPEYEEGIARVARRHGCATVLHEGGQVYAGVINIRCGPELFGWVIGHDDRHAKLRPGRLVQLASIRHAIARGYRTLHFLHGESSYKQELGGKVASLASYAVLRTWAAARPADLVRAARAHGARLARSSVNRADELAGRLLGARGAPVKSFVRSLAVAVRGAGRT